MDGYNKGLLRAPRPDDEWGTPLDFFNKINQEFNFQTDPCTTINNPLNLKFFYTKEENGLDKIWIGNVWINPPYSSASTWIAQARKRQLEGFENKIVVLIPATCTDTRWFHQYVYDQNTWQPYENIEIRFIKGRIKFIGLSENNKGKYGTPRFGSMLVIFHSKLS